METSPAWFGTTTWSCFSLPMRDGNNATVALSIGSKGFSLPMRDGNPLRLLRPFLLWSVLAYLWGMETSGVVGSSFWVSSFSLPMRDGNRFFFGFFRQFFLVLAYLWGMETPLHCVPYDFPHVLAYLWGMETKTALEQMRNRAKF